MTGTTKAHTAESQIDALGWRLRKRAGKHADPGHELGIVGGLSALSLDALSSLAYIPNKRRHEILHNQRRRLLEAVLKDRTNVVIAVLPFHIHD